MFEPLIVLGLFGSIVWVIAHAIFLLLRKDAGSVNYFEARDTIARFVEENYGTHFVPDDPLPEQCLRRL